MTNQNQWFPTINQEQCNGCSDCISQCPTGALGWLEGKAKLLYPKLCIYCATCEDICPVNAIELPFVNVKAEQRGK